MTWDPANYDNITVMRVLYAQIWNPGKIFQSLSFNFDHISTQP